MRVVLVALALAVSACSDDTESCPSGESREGNIGDVADVQLTDESPGWVDVFGHLWIPIGSAEPPEGPAVATLTADDRLAVTTQDGSAFTFGIVQCG